MRRFLKHTENLTRFPFKKQGLNADFFSKRPIIPPIFTIGSPPPAQNKSFSNILKTIFYLKPLITFITSFNFSFNRESKKKKKKVKKNKAGGGEVKWGKSLLFFFHVAIVLRETLKGLFGEYLLVRLINFHFFF